MSKHKIIILIFISLIATAFLSTYAIFPYLNYSLGFDKPINYFILLQNDNEIRANGGFTGSYAVANIDKAKVKLRFQDIYVPNGQIEGHIAPPPAIQEAFKQGTWLAANFDYEPDFPTSAKTFIWFMREGKEEIPQNIVTLNLSTIKKILQITGPLTLSDYNLLIKDDNIFELLQTEVESNFFAGSTKKKDILTTLGQNLFTKLQNLSIFQKISLAKLFLTELSRQNILLYSQNPKLQQVFIDQNWAGSFSPKSPDTYSLIELNLGANKANCCVTRHTTHTITRKNNGILHQITLNLKNTSPLENPKPPTFYGGNYIAYLRFYIPQNAQDLVVPENSTINDKFDFKEIGLFHTTPANSETNLSFSYTIPKNQNYALTILKQHGVQESPQSINLFGGKTKSLLKKDLTLH